jgi:hypothetical protein
LNVFPVEHHLPNMNTSSTTPRLHDQPFQLRVVVPLFAFLVSLPTWAAPTTGMGTGGFSNALPGRDPIVPYAYNRPQHVVWDSKINGLPSVSWGRPMDARAKSIVDADNYLWADGSGLHRETLDDGTPFQVPAELSLPQVAPENVWEHLMDDLPRSRCAFGIN